MLSIIRFYVSSGVVLSGLDLISSSGTVQNEDTCTVDTNCTAHLSCHKSMMTKFNTQHWNVKGDWSAKQLETYLWWRGPVNIDTRGIWCTFSLLRNRTKKSWRNNKRNEEYDNPVMSQLVLHAYAPHKAQTGRLTTQEAKEMLANDDMHTVPTSFKVYVAQCPL